MSNRTRHADQIRHYRELAQIAADCARKSPTHRADYLDLAKHWFELADSLEDEEPLGPKAKLGRAAN
jgi:hypothetical protein